MKDNVSILVTEDTIKKIGKVGDFKGKIINTKFLSSGFSLHQELKLLVEAGLTPTEALRGATSEAAKVLGTNTIGHIKPGAKADMVLFSEFVDSDINKIDRITHTILNSKPIKVDLKHLLSKPTLEKFISKKAI